MEDIRQVVLLNYNGFTYSAQAASLIIGLVFGSFLNVVVWRLCLRISAGADSHLIVDLSTPASHCPKCQHNLKLWQNLPILSWLLLKGRCYYCHERISIRYPLIEATCGLLFLCISSTITAPETVIQICLFSWFLIALSVIDYLTLQLPDALTQPLLWAGLMISATGFGISPEAAIFGAISGYLSLWFFNCICRFFSGKEGIGYGDFKLLAAIGAWVGWEILPLVCTLAAFSGIIFSFCWNKTGRYGQLIPFGPSLSAAGFIIYISQRSEILWLM